MFFLLCRLIKPCPFFKFTPRKKAPGNSKIAIIFIPKIIILLIFSPFPSFADEVEDGKAIYKTNCTPCHGVTGEGNGPKAEELKIKPQDHTNTTYMSTRTDEQLGFVIRNGGISISKSPLMPAWKGTLSDRQIKSVVKYLRKLCSCVFDSVISDPKLSKADQEFRE